MATRKVTKAAAFAAAADVLIGIAGNNPADAVAARAAAARAFIELGNSLGDLELTWTEDLAFATGKLKEKS